MVAIWDREEKARHRRQLAAAEQVKAERAKTLLDHPGFTDAMTRLEKDYVSRWLTAQTTAEREELWFRLQGLKALQSDVGAAASGGAVAAFNTRSLAE